MPGATAKYAAAERGIAGRERDRSVSVFGGGLVAIVTIDTGQQVLVDRRRDDWVCHGIPVVHEGIDGEKEVSNNE
jgi:hypothetical protein